MGHLLGKTDGEKEPSFPLPPSLQRSNFSILTGTFPRLTFNSTKEKSIGVSWANKQLYSGETNTFKTKEIFLYLKNCMSILAFFFFFCPLRKLANVRDIFGQCFCWTVTHFYIVDDKWNCLLYLSFTYFLTFSILFSQIYRNARELKCIASSSSTILPLTQLK